MKIENAFSYANAFSRNEWHLRSAVITPIFREHVQFQLSFSIKRSTVVLYVYFQSSFYSKVPSFLKNSRRNFNMTFRVLVHLSCTPIKYLLKIAKRVTRSMNRGQVGRIVSRSSKQVGTTILSQHASKFCINWRALSLSHSTSTLYYTELCGCILTKIWFLSSRNRWRAGYWDRPPSQTLHECKRRDKNDLDTNPMFATRNVLGTQAGWF